MDVEIVDNHKLKPSKKTKSLPLKAEYQMQIDMIKDQIGDLETIQQSLGLSSRKMSQLLMVDPSSWTRWSKKQVNPPPHIWRSLQFYFLLQKKWSVDGTQPAIESFHSKPGPGLSEQSKKIDSLSLEIKKKNSELSERNQELESKIENLELAVRANRASAFMIAAAFLILAFAFYKILLRA